MTNRQETHFYKKYAEIYLRVNFKNDKMHFQDHLKLYANVKRLWLVINFKNWYCVRLKVYSIISSCYHSRKRLKVQKNINFRSMGSRSRKSDAIWLSFLVGTHSLDKDIFFKIKKTEPTNLKTHAQCPKAVPLRFPTVTNEKSFTGASVYVFKNESGFGSTLLEQQPAWLI